MFKFLIFLLFVLLSQSDAQPRQKRLVDGLTAEVGSFPFVASLRDETWKHFCGAAIISDYFLITAASCIENKTPHEMHVYAGSVDQNHGGQNFSIQKLIVHENYTTESSENDIGLIQVTEPVTIESHVEMIEFLPRHLKVSAGDFVTAVGWGYLHYYKPKASKYITKKETNRLQYLDGTVLSDEKCANKTDEEINPEKICFDGYFDGYFDAEGTTALCYGDSGSPLLYEYAYGQYIVGVASWMGKDVCTPDSVGVNRYTNVSHYLDWIHDHMKEAEEENLGEYDYYDSEVEEGNPTEKSNLEESKKIHSEESTSTSLVTEKTNLWIKEATLIFKKLADLLNSA